MCRLPARIGILSPPLWKGERRFLTFVLGAEWKAKELYHAKTLYYIHCEPFFSSVKTGKRLSIKSTSPGSRVIFSGENRGRALNAAKGESIHSGRERSNKYVVVVWKSYNIFLESIGLTCSSSPFSSALSSKVDFSRPPGTDLDDLCSESPSRN